MSSEKPKVIDNDLLYRLWTYQGQAFRLDTNATPCWLRRFEYVYASGDSMLRRELWEYRRFENVVGGIDVFRPDPKDFDKGIRFNKDHYVITSANLICVYGPYKDAEHWLPDLPLGLTTAQYLRLN